MQWREDFKFSAKAEDIKIREDSRKNSLMFWSCATISLCSSALENKFAYVWACAPILLRLSASANKFSCAEASANKKREKTLSSPLSLTSFFVMFGFILFYLGPQLFGCQVQGQIMSQCTCFHKYIFAFQSGL